MLAIDIYNTNVTPLDISEYLLDRKVFTREGSYTSKDFGHRYLRVSFSIPPEDVKYFAKIFVEGMKTFKELSNVKPLNILLILFFLKQ